MEIASKKQSILWTVLRRVLIGIDMRTFQSRPNSASRNATTAAVYEHQLCAKTCLARTLSDLAEPSAAIAIFGVVLRHRHFCSVAPRYVCTRPFAILPITPLDSWQFRNVVVLEHEPHYAELHTRRRVLLGKWVVVKIGSAPSFDNGAGGHSFPMTRAAHKMHKPFIVKPLCKGCDRDNIRVSRCVP